jgi:hypothetical protein
MDEGLPDNDSKIEKVKRLKNSTLLRRYKVSNPELISLVVDFLYDELVEHYDLNGQGKSTIENLKRHIEFFVTNLYAVSRRDSTKYISFPLPSCAQCVPAGVGLSFRALQGSPTPQIR